MSKIADSACSDNLHLAIAVALPNLASLAGCAAVGQCTLSGICKAADHPNKCPIPNGAWHAALAAANCSVGYASYLIWKDLRGLGGHEHGAIAILLLVNAAHPVLVHNCDKLGCAPAVTNALVGVAAAGLGMYFFHGINKRATGFLAPGFALALLRLTCVLGCVGKKCCPASAGSGPCGPCPAPGPGKPAK